MTRVIICIHSSLRARFQVIHMKDCKTVCIWNKSGFCTYPIDSSWYSRCDRKTPITPEEHESRLRAIAKELAVDAEEQVDIDRIVSRVVRRQNK